jgi:thiomorpholine-carboxylate dehydrogenase
MVPYIDREQVRRSLSYDTLIPAMEAALAEFSAGRVVQPVREVLTVEEALRYFGIMPAALGDVMGAKLVSYYPRNAGTGIPTHQATIVLFHTDTGEPMATVDGTIVTEMRTAAVSAAVTKYLMPADSRILTLVGSGVQARSHLEALSHINQFDEVRVWSRTPAHAEEFARTHGARSMSLEVAVRDADVVVVATDAREPLLKGKWLKPGAHVNAVGACRPTFRELDDDVMANTLVVDSREAALKESGDVIAAKVPIAAEAGELFAGTKRIERELTTVFKSVGLAVEDIAAAKLVANR